MARVRRGVEANGYRTFARQHLRHLAFERLLRGLLRRIAFPSLDELSRSGGWCVDDEEVVRALLPAEAAALAPLEDEFRRLAGELDSRRADGRGDPRWSIQGGTARVLHALVRLTRPRLVLETGVADGNSSFFILRALAENGSGRLVSADVDAHVGTLLSAEERRRWQFHQLEVRHARRDFERLVRSLPEIDLFFHDSDHSYGGQMFEYTTVEPRLARDALVVSDDVDSSYAFLDYCGRRERTPVLLLDRSRVAGFLPPRARD